MPLTRDAFKTLFGSRAVFGMVHLDPLPGAPLWSGSMEPIIERALADARAIFEGGADALIFENFGDRPFRPRSVEPETIAAMTMAISEIRSEIRLPFGVNVLRNDAVAALGIATATGARFIRVNVLTSAMVTDQGIIEGNADEVLRRRRALGIGTAIFADHNVKHAVPLVAEHPVRSARDLRLRGLADVLIITGGETGLAASTDTLKLLRESLQDVPLVVGSGITPENARAYAAADGAIVGTALKRDGRVDRDQVARVVEAFGN